MPRETERGQSVSLLRYSCPNKMTQKSAISMINQTSEKILQAGVEGW
jgi:hypothetical protein